MVVSGSTFDHHWQIEFSIDPLSPLLQCFHPCVQTTYISFSWLRVVAASGEGGLDNRLSAIEREYTHSQRFVPTCLTILFCSLRVIFIVSNKATLI